MYFDYEFIVVKHLKCFKSNMLKSNPLSDLTIVREYKRTYRECQILFDFLLKTLLLIGQELNKKLYTPVKNRIP